MSIDIGRLFTNAWEKFSANLAMAIVVYLVGAIVGGLLGVITLGIAGVPVFVGLAKAMRKLQRGEAPEINDLFSEFSNFSKWIMLWVLGLVIGLVSGLIGLITFGIGAAIIGLAAGFVLFFVVQLMLEQNMPAFTALQDSFGKVKDNVGALFLPILLVLIVSNIFAPITGPMMAIASWDIYDEAYKS